MPTNRYQDGARGTDAIDLAREASFALAQLTIHPASLTVAAEGWSQRLEPRVMQVLIVLANASPAVVGRGELNARVWNGRMVGEDAINRAVQTLRRVAADAPPMPPFTIVTVPRVGYRLLPPGAAGLPADVGNPRCEASQAAAEHPRSRWTIIAASLATLTVVGGAVALIQGYTAQHAAPVDTWRISSDATLDDLPPGANSVTLSPGGDRIAYVGQDQQGRSRIFVRETDAAGVGDAISPAGIEARRPVWSPSGRDLAFSAFDADRPCRLYVLRPAHSMAAAGSCETEREPGIAWSADGLSLLFGDKPGQNAVLRISAVRVPDGRREVLSSPPGYSVGDSLPVAVGKTIVFQRRFGWATFKSDRTAAWNSSGAS